MLRPQELPAVMKERCGSFFVRPETACCTQETKEMPRSRIEVLDKATIDKIAAGEVVERPASVMKELLENSIDAGASAVTAEIRDGGISFLRVTDNGGGIPDDQMRTAFLRHATSKIRKAEDLVRVQSLGFRGEALSSISAVAQVECISKTPDALTGCRLCIEGGEEKEFEEIGAPSGTTIVVRNLFFNTPARAKFLKTPVTEASHVSSVVEELALSRPDVSVKYIVNGQTKLFTTGNGNLKEAAWQVYGRDLVKEMIPVEDSSDLMKIHGFTGAPGASRGNRNLENYFVNGRFVKNRILNKAIEDAYHGFLMQHRFPFTLLYLEIDCEKVDVNVHPAKMEVRISSGEEIYHQLCLAIQNALMNRERIPEATLDKGRKPADPRPAAASVPEPFETERRKAGFRQYKPGSSAPDVIRDGSRPSGAASEKFFSEKPLPLSEPPASAEKNAKPPVSHMRNPDRDMKSGVHAEAGNRRPAEVTPEGQQSLFREDRILSEQARRMFRLIGQVFGTYWLIEYEKELLIIDQHAAHEKVLYERLMKEWKEKKVISQMLLPAVVIHPSRDEAELLVRHMDVFRELGYDIEEFGGRSFKISAVPANLYKAAGEELFTELLGALGDTGNTDSRLLSEKIASMSCKAAVKGDHTMSPQEANALIDELLTLEDPYHCPHGRPVIIRMSRYELDRKFKRIV